MSHAAARAEVKHFDPFVVGPAIVLLGLGLVLVYSSSAVHAARAYHDAERFLRSQLVWAAFGLCVAGLGYAVPRRILTNRCGWLMLASLVSLALVLVPGIGRLAGGSRRWLPVAGVSCQPSEAAKLAVVVFLAALLARRARAQQGSLLGPVLAAQLPVVLILCEPDLGGALMLECLMLLMVFAAGLPWRTLICMGLLALPALYHLTFGTPFRLRRLLSYIDPWAYRSTVGYQVTEALISIGSGGIFGVGLGEGKQKLFFLPEAHTDFIFAILAEELGLCGVLLVLASFACIVWRGIALTGRVDDPFDRYLALGLTGIIGLPALFNAAVATGLLPTKGLPLPFISYGGSHLVITFAAVGLLSRVYRDATTSPTAEGR